MAYREPCIRIVHISEPGSSTPRAVGRSLKHLFLFFWDKRHGKGAKWRKKNRVKMFFTRDRILRSRIAAQVQKNCW